MEILEQTKTRLIVYHRPIKAWKTGILLIVLLLLLSIITFIFRGGFELTSALKIFVLVFGLGSIFFIFFPVHIFIFDQEDNIFIYKKITIGLIRQVHAYDLHNVLGVWLQEDRHKNLGRDFYSYSVLLMVVSTAKLNKNMTIKLGGEYEINSDRREVAKIVSSIRGYLSR
ncbi:MAG: hypothetical protein F6K58_31260 [Symploca sp. SIO2E9]|nr:hypothetical protein [Symploca sp. SIO2E9]